MINKSSKKSNLSDLPEIIDRNYQITAHPLGARNDTGMCTLLVLRAILGFSPIDFN
jgi:hypothetical protein